MRRGTIQGRPRERCNSSRGSTCCTISHRSSGIRQIVGNVSCRALAPISTPPPPRSVRCIVGVYYRSHKRSSVDHVVVGVGTAVARGPLHRSGRAALPHPAPALGDDAKAHEGIRVADADGRKPPVDVALHPAPRQVVLLAAATQGPPPQPSHCLAESTERRAVHRDPVVPDMAPNDSPEIGALLRDGKMQAVPQLRFHFLELGLPPRTHRLPQHREATRPLFAQLCVKPRKLKVSGFPSPRPRRAWSANRPNSRRRVLSGCSSRPNRSNRSRSSARNCTASCRCSNPTTKSSAKRTTMTSPRACLLLQRRTQRSNT